MSTGCKCECTYESLTKWTKLFTFGISGTVIALGIQKFFNIFNAADIFGYIINIYLMYFILYKINITDFWDLFSSFLN